MKMNEGLVTSKNNHVGECVLVTETWYFVNGVDDRQHNTVGRSKK